MINPADAQQVNTDQQNPLTGSSQSQPPRVSVVMPVYNYAEFIPRAVNSLLVQGYTNWELIISDNASTDNTEVVARAFAAQDKRIHYFRNETNVGVCGNFNLCEARAHPDGQYLIGLPADDWLHPEALEKLVTAADAHPDVVLVHCDGFRMEGNVNLGRYTKLFKYVPAPGKHHELAMLYRNDYIPFQGGLVNRKLARELYPTHELHPKQGLHDPELDYTSDYHLWLQLLSRGGLAYYIDEPLVYILKHERANTMPANLIPRLHQEVRVFEKLADVCPDEFQAVRTKSLSDRLARLSFLYMQAGQLADAKIYLQRAGRLSPTRRLDLTIASAISALPLPPQLRTQLWQLAKGTRAALRRS
ncbi:MAG: glycosyltransferase family 2 protein [Deinococcota bacterium]